MTRAIPQTLHWLILAAFLVIPNVPLAYGPASILFEYLFHIDPARINYGFALSRILLIAWILALVFLQAPRRMERSIREAAGSWTSLATIAISVGLVGLFIGLFLSDGPNPFFSSFASPDQMFPLIYREDHLMENLTAVSLFLSALLLLVAAIRQRTHSPPVAGILLLLAVFIFFLAGEEISWGQRIAEWQSEGVFNRYNVQNETNLHNFVAGKTTGRATIWIMAALTFCAVYADRIVQALPVAGMRVLIPSAGVRISIVVAALASVLTVQNELVEEVIAWVLLCYSAQLVWQSSGRVDGS